MKIETVYAIGDRFVIAGGWTAVCTAIIINADHFEYRLEWVGETEFNEEWLTKERMNALGIFRKEND